MVSYSALTSYGKVTLPSVESWNGNFNIVKNPPSGIHTRRVIKVGEDNDLLNRRDDSGSRINEMIKFYARGSNPMVAVQYSNHGNFGNGMMGVTGGTAGTSMNGLFVSGGGGKLPYRIMNRGAFRPPIRRQEDLMPLSRMRRSCTSVASKRCKVDQTKSIKPDVVEHFKYVHDVVMNLSVTSNRVALKNSGKPVGDYPSEGYHRNASKNEILNFTVDSNLKKLKDTNDVRRIPLLKDALRVSYADDRHFKKTDRQNYIHSEPVLDKNVPSHSIEPCATKDITRNVNSYESNGVSVVMASVRPSDRAVSKFGTRPNGTVRSNQTAPITGAVLKSRGIH